jgi:hypothetical protein
MLKKTKGTEMKYIFLLLMSLALPACVTNPEVKNSEVSPAQHYQFEGDDASTRITGVLEKYGNDWAYHGAYLTVKIGNEKVIARKPVDKYNFSGEVAGGVYRDKKVSASCNGFAVTDRWTDVHCVIFVGNQQTVTLVF